MAQQRQESSVSVSIEELLREAHAREEQERRDAVERARAAEQRRIDELRRMHQAEEARLRAEEAERRRRAFDEERRQVELRALHEGTVERARAEAQLRARLAELTARQEHERSLQWLAQDRHKKRLTRVVALLTVLAVAGGAGTAVAIKRSKDAAAAADARLRGARDDRDRLEHEQARLKQDLANASDPGDVARLQQQLADAQRQLKSFTTANARAPAVHPPGAVSTTGPAKAPATPRTPEACPKGDPLCPTIQ
jgi:colicin import membrane protein